MTGTVTKRGRASYRLKFDLPAGTKGGRKTVYETIRAAGIKEARLELAKRLAAVGQGSFVEPSRLTVAAHVQARIAHWSASGVVGAKATKRYEVLLAHQIGPFIGDVTLQKLATTDVEKWHGKLKAAGLSHCTIQMAHRITAKALDDAVRHNLLSRNVCRLQRVPKGSTAQVEIITADQIDHVVRKLQGTAIGARALLALTCGLRAGEINALTWAAIDLDKRQLHVRQATEEVMGQPVTIKSPKTRAGRRSLSVPDVAIAALRDHRREQLELRMAMGLGRPAEDALVFPALDGGPAGTANLSRQWRRAVAALDLPNVNFHALRHSHASQLIAAKVDLATIAARLGHANPSVTLKTYGHLFEKDDSAAADVINRALGARPVPKNV